MEIYVITYPSLRNFPKHKQVITIPNTNIYIEFFIACLLLGLEYIHSNHIIHRDIKPENLVCDNDGYIHITDFGVAKTHKPDNSSETSGTPGYMAPEVLCAQNHSYVVDFFAIGVMGYEFMLGTRPYLGRSRREIKQAVLRKQVTLTSEQLAQGWSTLSMDFINKCLQRKDIKRLGYTNGVSELKQHEWFNDIDWNKLYAKALKSPFTIKGDFNYDKKYCEALDKLSPETIERYQSYMKREDFISLFINYTCIDNILQYNNDTQDNNNNNTNLTNTSNTRGTKTTFTKASTNTNSSVNNNHHHNISKEELTSFKKGNQRIKANHNLLKKSLSSTTFSKVDYSWKKENISRETRAEGVRKGEELIKSKSYADVNYDKTNFRSNSVGLRNMKFNFGNVNLMKKSEGSNSCKVFAYQGKPSIDTGTKSILPNINIHYHHHNAHKYTKNSFYRFYNSKRIGGLMRNKLNHSCHNNSSSNNSECQYNPLLNHVNKGFSFKKVESANNVL